MSHSRLPCPPLIPRVCLSSRSRSQWCCLTISSSVTPFSFCLQSFPRSGSFPMSQLLASVLPMNIKDWFPLGLTGLISLQSYELSRVFSNTTVRKHQFFSTQPSLWSTSHILYVTTIALIKQTFVNKVMSLLLNMPSRFVIAFLPRSKHFLI